MRPEDSLHPEARQELSCGKVVSERGKQCGQHPCCPGKAGSPSAPHSLPCDIRGAGVGTAGGLWVRKSSPGKAREFLGPGRASKGSSDMLCVCVLRTAVGTTVTNFGDKKQKHKELRNFSEPGRGREGT